MHRTSGTFALSRLSDENKKKLIDELSQIPGGNVRLDNKGLNATVEFDSIDFNTARSRYNEYIYAAKRAELEAQGVSASHLPSAETMEKRTQDAAKQAQEARSATDGTLMSNPPAMRNAQRGTSPRELNSEEATAKFGDKQKSEMGNLPANSPPPGMTEEGASDEYLQAEAERRLHVPDGGQVNSGANPVGEYAPPQPEQPQPETEQQQ